MKRFWDKVDKSGVCWLWAAGLDTAGYGQFKFEKKTMKAHRVSFFLANGYWPGICRHTCDNPPCVNPNHLVDGTQVDNMFDMYDRERNFGIKKTQLEEIDAIPMSRTIVADVAEQFDVSEDTARRAISRTRAIVRQKSRSKLSIEDIIAIKRALQTPYWGQVNVLAERYGVTHSQISHIKSGYIHGDVSIDN